VGGAGDGHQLGARHRPRELGRVLGCDDRVAVTAQNQRRYLELGELRPQVPADEQALDLVEGAGLVVRFEAVQARRLVNEAREALGEGRREGESHEGAPDALRRQEAQQVAQQLQAAPAMAGQRGGARGEDQAAHPARRLQRRRQRDGASHARAEQRESVVTPAVGRRNHVEGRVVEREGLPRPRSADPAVVDGDHREVPTEHARQVAQMRCDEPSPAASTRAGPARSRCRRPGRGACRL